MILRNNTHSPVMKRRLSIQEIKSRIIDESFELVSSEYVNAHTKLDWRCFECGNVFHSSWLNVSFGWGCPVCKSIKNSTRIKEMRKLKGDGIYLVEMLLILSEKGLAFVDTPGDYISNLSKKYRLYCLSCDNIVSIRLRDIKNKVGYGCWNCSRPKGSQSHFWRGGSTKEYPIEWNNSLRESIRNRDNRLCQYPNCSYSDSNKNQRLHVHHINGYKQDCRSVNLISLCNKHHTKIESTKPRDWEDYFYSITRDYEWRK